MPKAHCATLRKDLVDVGLVCDRSSASKCLAKDHDDLMLASCWAHVRRDVLKAARSWPAIERWMCAWVDDIRALSRLHAARREVWEETVRLEQQPAAFVERHRDLETPLSQRQTRGAAHLQEPDLHLVKPKVLSRLPTHWDGLPVWLLLDSKVVDLRGSSTPTFVALSFVNPFFFNGLKNELRCLDKVGA